MFHQFRLLAFAGSILLLTTPSFAKSKKACGPFEKVEFSDAKVDLKNPDGSTTKDYAIRRAVAGPFQLDAGDAPAKVLNTKTNTVCIAKVKIVTGTEGDIHWLKGTDRALYSSYSGSEQWLTLVDLNSCQTLWESRPNIGSKVRESQLEIIPDCGACEENGKMSGVCECQAAEAWKLSPDCGLAMDTRASERLTKDILHVGFVGKKKVQAARSSSAKLVR